MRKIPLLSSVVFPAFVLFAMMFVVVMFFVNPAIDGGDGMGLLRLQLAFDKTEGLRIAQSWGETGVRNFRKLIVFDYVYAVSYVLLLVTAIGYFTGRCRGGRGRLPLFFISLAVLAGVFDGIENSLEIFFLSSPEDFPAALFFLHSVVAVLKWMMVFCVVGYLVVLGVKRAAGNGPV